MRESISDSDPLVQRVRVGSGHSRFSLTRGCSEFGLTRKISTQVATEAFFSQFQPPHVHKLPSLTIPIPFLYSTTFVAFSLIRVLVNSLLPHEENYPAHFVCWILPIPVEHLLPFQHFLPSHSSGCLLFSIQAKERLQCALNRGRESVCLCAA